MKNNKNNIILYHANCTDGFGAAYAAWKKFGDTAEYVPMSYGQMLPDTTDKHVYMVDWSVKKEVMKAVAKISASVTVLDHHKSAEADVGDLIRDGVIGGLFDMKKSGAVIAWEWFHPTVNMPALFMYLQDYDLWTHQYAKTREIIAGLRSYKMTFSRWSKYAGGDPLPLMALADEGKHILRNHNQSVKDLASNARRVYLAGFEIPCVNANGFLASDLGNLLCQDQPFSATYFTNENGEDVVSLRSDENGEDVSEVAAGFGGGGHQNSEGFVAHRDMRVFG